ncbi:YidC/Oxa1 family membrane protein insertase [Rhodococcus erythropolis]|nr:YidC/Oxa1 family membrane protein insertase [Rhodococcus erythropolis]MCW2425469.1 YidC/Oxa1 family membrane protein insertase [Rhodococcus erythropolis]
MSSSTPAAILWLRPKAFGSVLGPNNAFAWVLVVVFLVFTLRILLLKPAIRQARTTRRMQELGPRMKALQHEYAGDLQKQLAEIQKPQKKHGFNPLMGFLAVLVQAPVFLFHVLRSFKRTGTGLGQLGMPPEANGTPETTSSAPRISASAC